MPRATGNDLSELFGFAPDDNSPRARALWKSGECPFVGGICVKHSHPQSDGKMAIYGSCSVKNNTRSGPEEVIICPQRLYASDYETLKNCVRDATGEDLPVFSAKDFPALKKAGKLPKRCFVQFGHNCGKEISISNKGLIDLSLDWVMAEIADGKVVSLIPIEVQSIDTTGNYRDAWSAYSKQLKNIPDSEHGMNWANVWKRLIPQLILKGAVASTSKLCSHGIYFVVPDRVYLQFEKLVGQVESASQAGPGVMTVVTYSLGKEVSEGKIRPLAKTRTVRMLATDFAKAFASGKQLPLGTQLDKKVQDILSED